MQDRFGGTIIETPGALAVPDFGGDTQNATARAAANAARESKLANIIPDFEKKVVGLAQTESSLGLNNFSPTGPKGPFQFAKATAEELGLDTSGDDERFDPEKSAKAAVRYLEELHDQFGNERDAFTAYNFGPGALRQAKNGTRPFTEEAANYYDKVLTNTAQLFPEGATAPGTPQPAAEAPTQIAAAAPAVNTTADRFGGVLDPVEPAAPTEGTAGGLLQPAVANAAPGQDQGPEPVNPILGALEKAQEQMLFGFGDEAAAGMQTAIEFIKGAATGQAPDFGETFTRNLEGNRARLRQFENENPTTAALAGGAGAALPALVTGGASIPATGGNVLRQTAAAVNNLRAPGQVALGATTGGATAALSAAGNAEENRLQAAQQALPVGAAFGGLVPAVVSAPGAVRNAFNDIQEVVGGGNATNVAQQQVARAFARDDVTANAAQTTVEQLGPDAVLADAGGRNVRKLADSLSNLPGRAKQQVTDFVETRQLGRNARVTDTIDEELAVSNAFFEQSQQIIARRAETAAPLYEQAYASSVQVTDKMRSSLRTQAAAKAYKDAVKLADTERLPIADIPIENGFLTNIPDTLDTRTLDLVKRGLDDSIGKAQRGGTRNRVSALTNLKNDLIEDIDLQNPVYAEARGVYAGESALLDSLEVGRKFLTEDSKLSTSALARMSDSEKEVFRIGAAKAIRDKVLSAKDGAAAYSRIFGDEVTRERIEAVMPSPEAFDNFAKSMKREQIFTETKNAIRGNSETVERMFAAGEFAAGVKEKVVRGVISKAFNQIQAPREEVAEEVAKILLNSRTNIGNVSQELIAVEQKSRGAAKQNVQSVISILGGVNIGASGVATEAAPAF